MRTSPSSLPEQAGDRAAATSTTMPRWCARRSPRPAGRRSSSPTPTAACPRARPPPAQPTSSSSRRSCSSPGQSLLGLRGGVEPEWWIASEDGRSLLPDNPRHVFYNDCPPEVAERAAAALVPHSRASSSPGAAAPRPGRPCPRPTSSASATTRSRRRPRSSCRRAPGNVSRLDASHSPFLSRPDDVTAIIQEAPRRALA